MAPGTERRRSAYTSGSYGYPSYGDYGPERRHSTYTPTDESRYYGQFPQYPQGRASTYPPYQDWQTPKPTRTSTKRSSTAGQTNTQNDRLFRESREAFRNALRTDVLDNLAALAMKGISTQPATSDWTLNDATLHAWNDAMRWADAINPDGPSRIDFDPRVETRGSTEWGYRFLLKYTIRKGNTKVDPEGTYYDARIPSQRPRQYMQPGRPTATSR